MSKELQVQTLKKLFSAYNIAADESEIDWEHYIDRELSLPENIMLMRSNYPQYRWSKEDREEELENLELQRMRERENELRRIKKERKELSDRVAVDEERIRQEITRAVGKEVGELKRELADLRDIRRHIDQPESNVDELRKELDTAARRIHEVEVILMGTLKRDGRIDYFTGVTNLEEAKTRYRELSRIFHPDVGGDAEKFKEVDRQYDEIKSKGISKRPAGPGRERAEEPIYRPEPVTRICIGNRVVGEEYIMVPNPYLGGMSRIKTVKTVPCKKEFTINDPLMEERFLQLLIYAKALSGPKSIMLRSMCLNCQREAFGGTIIELVHREIESGGISASDIRSVGLSLWDFLDIMRRAGFTLTEVDIQV
jgi:hypothetical protein